MHGFSYANYLAELGAQRADEIYEKSSLDGAMRDAFRKMRHFLMTTKGLCEDEAISLMSVAADFGVTQVVDGNWGVHGIVEKRMFADASSLSGRIGMAVARLAAQVRSSRNTAIAAAAAAGQRRS